MFFDGIEERYYVLSHVEKYKIFDVFVCHLTKHHGSAVLYMN